jgi:hypothetical protein
MKCVGYFSKLKRGKLAILRDVTKMDLKETQGHVVDWIYLFLLEISGGLL